MSGKHHLSHATELYYGPAFFGPGRDANERVGSPITPLTKISLGSPVAADVDHLVDAATSTELPDAADPGETVTWTTADDGSSPFDNGDTPAPAAVVMADGTSVSVWSLDVPRNISVNVTHASSIVAMSLVVTGYDVWGQKVVESFTVTATGTTKTVAGKKAFKHISQIAVTAAADASTNTLNVGTGDVLGLPYRLPSVADCLGAYFNDALDGSATVVAGVDTTPTATTGDVRGTIDPDSACDGSAVVAWMAPDPTSKITLYGKDQYAG